MPALLSWPTVVEAASRASDLGSRVAVKLFLREWRDEDASAIASIATDPPW
jgi:hypothetical protein